MDPITRAQETAASVLRWYGRATYPWVRLTTLPAARRLFRLRVAGRHNLPRRGGAVVAPNHLSFVDPFFVALAIPRQIVYLGKAEYWDSWVTRWFVELGGGIPVRREDPRLAQGSLAAGVDVLQEGRLLGIFPEGTRTPDGRLYKGKTGFARMALEAGCPVIPTGITGTDIVLPKDAKVPRVAPVSVTFGKPRHVPEEARHDHGALRVFTDEVMHEIARYTGQTYRDRYAYTKRVSYAGPPQPAWP